MADISGSFNEKPADLTIPVTPLQPLYQQLLLWTILISSFAAWESYQAYQFEMNTAIIVARDNYNKDLVYRKWATIHGGVYVPIAERTPPNPYLAHLPERDITTPSGRRLTLMNPAYMTRQAHEIGREQYGLRGHITSLKPIRPENAPDAWETKGLKEFEKGASEYTSKEMIDGVPYIRFIHALLVEEGCLKCHGGQGYKKGDVRGGISVSVPWKPYRDRIFGILPMEGAIFGFVWIVGVVGTVAGRRRLLRHLEERNSAEKERQRYSRLLRRTGDMARVGGWELNVSDRQLFWSEQVFHIHGIEPGRTVTVDDALGYYTPEGRPLIQGAIQAAIAAGTPFDLELPLITANGTSIWVRAQGEAEYGGEKIVKIVGAIQEITGRKQAEKDLLDKNSEMERFTYTVSHDLKSPLITIQSYAGMILNDMAAGNHERARDDIQRIEGAAAKMTELLGDLMELSRAGKMMNEPALIDMNLLINDCLAQLVGPLKQKQIEVTVQPDLPAVVGDRYRVSEVLQNLVENAIKYMGDQVTPCIKIGTREEGRETVFFVGDNGVGIDPLYQDKIFGLFNKLDAKSPGTGVGLALVKRIIEVHGGRVWVESEGRGHGSCFCFTLAVKRDV